MNSIRILSKLEKSPLVKFSSTSSNEVGSGIAEFCVNRNPRNLEKLRIARKPIGFHLDKKGREFWNKIIIKTNRSSRSITAEIVHNSGHTVVTASTKEAAISKYLYSKNDLSAHVNLARVLADRCIETGISEVACFIDRKPGTKVTALLDELEKQGIALSEPPEYEHPQPSDMFRPEKPWEVF